MSMPNEGDTVEIIPPTGDEFDNDRIGTVVNRDGHYVLVERNKSKVQIELYPCELNIISRNNAA